MRLLRTGLAVLVLLTCAVVASAQDGVITGKVTDTSGAPLPGVTLTVTSAAVMGARSQVTDDQGSYRFGLLPPGTYTLKLELVGFSTVIREGIQMTAGF